ncbi:T9SS type A sorting domain-containing protein [Rufibacter psychrotolerans]|uniref:T9SS type A sorting domain-containing protein n=1 Tax=Rufibacter psychrotolerans TaxID=2812556 RepID=UPI001967A983|nr:T9SS type A sorting domain-containing protein [Rufibacter sp. SYSU D00308]
MRFSLKIFCKPFYALLMVGGFLFLTAGAAKAQAWKLKSPPPRQKTGISSLQKGLEFTVPQGERMPLGARDLEPSVTGTQHAGVEGDAFWSDRFNLSGTDGHIRKALEAEGKLYVIGQFTSIGNTVARNIAMWDGQTWHALGSGTNLPITDLVWHRGELYIGGNFSEAGGVRVYGIARWDGDQWHPVGNSAHRPGLNSGFVGEFFSDEANQKLYIAGSFSKVDEVEGTSNLAVWDGATWASVGGGADGGVSALLVHQGKVFIGGSFLHAGGKSIKRAAYLHNGEWHQLGTTPDGPDSSINELVLESAADNTLLAGGTFRTIDGVALNGIARYSIATNTWSPLQTGGKTGVMYEGAPGEVATIKVVNGAIYLGGAFDEAYGVKANSVALYTKENGIKPIGTGLGGVSELVIRANEIMAFGGAVTANGLVKGEVNGSFYLNAGDTAVYGMARATFTPETAGSEILWRTFSGKPFFGTDGYIRKILVHKGDLYVAGSFSRIGHDKVRDIARWNGRHWMPLGSGVGNGYINDMVTIGNDLYVGGWFGLPNQDKTTSHLVARWDGSEWHGLGQGVGGYQNSEVLDLETDGTHLYVAGILLESAGNPDGTHVSIANIAQWNGQQWRSLGPGLDLDGMVYSLLYHQGKLYAGGGIRLPGNQTLMSDLAKWDGQQWSSIGHFDHVIRSITQEDNVLYVGGRFTEVNRVTTGALVKGTGDGQWESVGNISGGNVAVVTSLYRHNGLLFVGGVFQNAGALTGVNGMAYLNRAGDWKSMGSGANGSAHSMLGVEDQLWIGGNFTLAGGKPAYGLTTWRDPGVIKSVPLEQAGATKPRVALLYPNPTAGSIRVLGQKSQITGFVLRDLNGRILLEKRFAPTLEWHLPSLPLTPGLYLAEIYTNKGKQLEKLVVQ